MANDARPTLYAKPGDCVLSATAFPDIDQILVEGRFGDELNRNPTFVPMGRHVALDHLGDYLRFLELIVLYERVVILGVAIDRPRNIFLDHVLDLSDPSLVVEGLNLNQQ
jgi:hypothetical protein